VSAAAIVSMLVKREDAALLSVIVCLIAGCLCGFGPSIRQGKQYGFYWIQALSFASWATEGWLDSETSGYRDLFMVEEITAPLFGYTLNRFAMDIGIAFLLAIVYRIIAFFLLLVVDRQKQR
jgi:hypothetical protein